MSKSTGAVIALAVIGIALVIKFLPLIILGVVIWALTRGSKEKA